MTEHPCLSSCGWTWIAPGTAPGHPEGLRSLSPLICARQVPPEPVPGLVAPDTFADYDAAARWQPEEPRAELVGGFLHEDEAQRFLDEEVLGIGAVATVRRTLQGPPSLAADAGEELGWEVLGWDEHSAHSWLENGLPDVVLDELNLRAGQHGLLTEPDAEAIAGLLNRDDLGPPVIWRPVCLIRRR